MVATVDVVVAAAVRHEAEGKEAGRKEGEQKREQREGEDNLEARGRRITQRAYVEDWISQ